MLADDVAQRRQGELLYGAAKIFYRQHRLLRIVHFVPENRVYLNGNAVAGDRFLLLDGFSHDAEVDPEFVLDAQRNEPEKAGSPKVCEAAQPEDYGALVFPGYPQSRNHDQAGQDNSDRKD